ncbi:nitrous-oxide reductase [Caldalkalibacillus uzonensis]|uniref:Nitrous-oxide reductase n=1 Tax=Caldalkalibacillus uzonensis TaxID=353224 RepID=A0ABU0CRU2_9BACI|nr:Sec-dependent nitrous-oxide reductase [Caldalkalibacillus uzonensis]MDQ0339074.1 nitrous-oxide reductase [Caldalkalibacillus uzonensis]
MKKQLIPVLAGLLAGVLVATLFFAEFTTYGPYSTAGVNSAAEKVYVPLGEHDDYYLIASGGHSGQLYVYGIPSMRRIRTVPVFTPDPATGYGFNQKTKEMLGGYTWGDFHHPALSLTEGEYDGKWLFATDVANNRIAVLDLKTFMVKDMLKVPNTGGPHCSAFVTENTEYIFLPTRFSVPFGHEYASLDDYEKKFKGVMSAVTFDEETQKLELAYQVALPPYSYDVADTGKGISADWAVITTYNTELATTDLEINASQFDRDYLVLFNWRELEKKIEQGEYDLIDGIKVIDPLKHKGGIYLVPAAKSPHGVDVTPDGKYFISSGKLAPLLTVFSFEKAFEAIEKEKFVDEKFGIPVLDYESVMVREVNPENALGPLHTTFDDQGYAYSSMFISSEVIKWNYETGEVVDRVDVHYSPGHLVAAEGDTKSPKGEWLVSLNKMAKDNFLSVGPSHPESMQLIDISGDKMEVVLTVPVDPEPHYAQIISADKINPIHVFEKDEGRPNSVWRQEDARIERKGNEVHVYGIAMRSKYIFDANAKRKDVIEVEEGDRVFIHLTNIDLDQDITHGLGISDYDLTMEIQPGETVTLEFTADKAGTYPLYCTNFCSALHQEMKGYLLVKPKK